MNIGAKSGKANLALKGLPFMNVSETTILGCSIIELDIIEDGRGCFVKTFNSKMFEGMGITCRWQEQYYTISKKNVLRGMHFQLPPYDYDKLVTCVKGKVLDVVVDLRKDSPTLHKVISLELSEENRKIIYISNGLAHGFLSQTDNTIMLYNASTVYAQEYDAGILWSSIDLNWPCKDPIVSARDQKHPAIEKFDSPF